MTDTDIVERLLVAVRNETQENNALHKDAADEIERLRAENKRIMSKLEQYQKLGEPEF